MKKKVSVAMSGGVDSSVAAFLLKNEGYDVTGITMCFGAERGGEARCCGTDAIDDARRVCERLNLSHYVFDFSRELEDKIIHKFIDEYRRGRTPNPCIDCNRYLKFGSLLEKTSALGFDYIATGHYAKIEREEERFFLKRPKDKVKDQTYFLYAIPYEALNQVLFPLASLTKEEVRSIARKAELPVAEKLESQDLCFVGRNNYPDFVSRQMGAIHGPIVDMKGKRLGTHKGIAYYTIGQRSGLGIAHSVPLYVLSIDAVENRIVVGEKAALRAKGLVAAGDLNIIAENWPSQVYAKIRYRRRAAKCSVAFENGRIKVLFKEEEEAVTPGQAVVFYHHDYVLGGGTIEEVIRAAC